MTRPLLLASLALGAGLTAWAYFSGGHTGIGCLLAILGAAWIAGEVLNRKWVSTAGLFVFFGSVATGFYLDFPAAILLPAAAFIFIAWDLADLAARLRLAAPEDDVAGLERRHFLRLVVVLLIGCGSGAVALWLHVKPSFEWTILLAVFGVWGLGRISRWLLQK